MQIYNKELFFLQSAGVLQDLSVQIHQATFSYQLYATLVIEIYMVELSPVKAEHTGFRQAMKLM